MAKKLELTVEEKVQYNRTIKIETNLNEDELNVLLDRAEKEHHPEDFAAFLEGKGVKVIQYPDSNYSSPYDCELECIDLMEIDE